MTIEKIVRFDGFAFKKSEMTTIITEIAIYGIMFDQNMNMALMNYITNEYERITNEYVAEYLFEKRDELNLKGYNKKKCIAAVRLSKIFIKKCGEKEGFISESDRLPLVITKEAQWE